MNSFYFIVLDYNSGKIYNDLSWQEVIHVLFTINYDTEVDYDVLKKTNNGREFATNMFIRGEDTNTWRLYDN
jgi:hypothetical protein